MTGGWCGVREDVEWTHVGVWGGATGEEGVNEKSIQAVELSEASVKTCIHRSLQTYQSLLYGGHGPVQNLTNTHMTTNDGVQVRMHWRDVAGL
jgi:hypothetical protein